MPIYQSQNIFAIWALPWPFFWLFIIPSINDGLNPNLKRGDVPLRGMQQKYWQKDDNDVIVM